MITLMNASAARKDTIKKQWRKIKNIINEAIRAGKFKIQFEEDLFDDNITQLEKLKYTVEYVYNVNKSDWVWQISW